MASSLKQCQVSILCFDDIFFSQFLVHWNFQSTYNRNKTGGWGKPEAPDVPLRAKRRDATAPAVASTGRWPKAAPAAPRAVVPRAVVPRAAKTVEIKEAPPVARVAEVTDGGCF